MKKPYRPVVTEGAGSGFNPKCNLTFDPEAVSKSIPSVAEVAAEAMRKRAVHRAQEEAYNHAKEASRRKLQVDPKRWLSNNDLT